MGEAKSKQVSAVEHQERAAGPVRLTQTLTITKRIGKGRFGVVYAAVHQVLARRFAVKVLRPALTKSEGARHRLRRLVREASQVEHPNIVGLVDVGQVPDGRFYLTMDYVRGMQASRVLDRDGRLPVERALPLLLQLAEALEAAHRGRVIHGDLKPNNITVVERAAGRELVRVHDWMLATGLAEPTEKADVLTHLQNHGTVDYLAPEQLTARSAFDARVDQYAFGAIGYHMLTGQPPFTGEPEKVAEAHATREPVPMSRRSGVDDVSEALDQVILRCLEKDPNDRFRSMEGVLRALEGLWLTRSPIMPGAMLEGEGETVEEEPAQEEQLEEEELLPESPARLRRLLYDTILELVEQLSDAKQASEDLLQQARSFGELREESTQLVVQMGRSENRFEDIRRELREGESAMRYAIIDLNLAKSDLIEKGCPPKQIDQIDERIGEVERNLVDLEQQRTQRFSKLNEEIGANRERLKALEQQMALRFRHLYSQVTARRQALRSGSSRALVRRLERCRAALSSALAD
jgi:serine/threonine protein kinase